MGTQENIALVRRGYDAFSSGDMATLGQLFAEDAVWNSPGTGVISGRERGARRHPGDLRGAVHPFERNVQGECD